MFSIIPILLLAVFILNTMQYLLYDSVHKVGAQEKFNMLTVIGDYVVKNADGGAYSDNEKVYPNLIEPSKLSGLEDQLGSELGMSNLEIMLESRNEPPIEEKTCIYRVVVNHDSRQIDRLFICG